MATTAELAKLSQLGYKNTGMISGWDRLDIRPKDNPYGYDGAAFGRRDAFGNIVEIVVVHRGTELRARDGDLVANWQLATGRLPDQYAVANQFLKSVEDIAGNAQIGITGHSLGASIAELQGAQWGYRTETFNAYGVKQLLPALVDRFGDPTGHIAAGDFSNVVNHRTLFDPVSMDPRTAHIGEIRTEIAPGEVPVMAAALATGPSGMLAAAITYSHSIDRFADGIYGNGWSWRPGLADFLRRLGGDNLVFEAVLASFQNSTSPVIPRRDPLALDLDGGGIETLGVQAGAHFDHDGNGFAERTGWVGPGDGLLVWDRNGDGRINDGGELFGDQTALASGRRAGNGFQALAEWDGNGDGRIDARDAVWAKLQVWQDGDGDGYTSARELRNLADLGIQSIGLDARDANVADPQGNTLARVGSFTRVDGSTGQVGDYLLRRDTTYTLATEWRDVPAAIADLPDLAGYGNVYDLHQAMVRDGSGALQALVQEFAAEVDPAARSATLEKILFAWTGSGAVNPASRGGAMDARRIAVLEQFFGQESRGNPDYAVAVRWEQSYQGLAELFYGQLMAQTHLKDLYALVAYTWDEAAQGLRGDLGAVVAELQGQLARDPTAGQGTLAEFARSLRSLGAQEVVNYLAFRETFISQDESLGWIIDAGGLPVYDRLHQGQRAWSPHIEGTDRADAVHGSLTQGDGYLNGLVGDDVIYGTARNETLINEQGDALLVAGAGNDSILAGAGDDILDGGLGNDRLMGEGGNDTYLFRRGSGQDVIIDSDVTAGNVDTLWLGGNLTPADITIRRAANNLVLSINDANDTLTVEDFFKNGSTLNQIERIQFQNGAALGLEDIYALLYAPTDADDVLYGTPKDDILRGLGGDDRIYGQGGDDIFDGGSGNDTLIGGLVSYGYYGLNAGSGSNGNDTYLFGRGAGQDVIIDADAGIGNRDTILFGADIALADVALRRDGDDLVLVISGATDRLTVKDYFKDETPTNQIERIQFADGTNWDVVAVQRAVLQGTVENDRIIAYSGNDIANGGDGDDSLSGLAGDDALQGNAGNDLLFGGAGADMLAGGDGDDTLAGGLGNDTLSGDLGNDVLYGGNVPISASPYYSSYYYPASQNGNDTYLFGRGFGQDTVIDRDGAAGNIDTVQMTPDIAPTDVLLNRSGEDLILAINGSSDRLTVKNWFWNDGNEWQVERIAFADGAVWDVAAIKNNILLQGTPGDDSLFGYATAETIQGLEGNDLIYARQGDDILQGGAGDDYLSGEGGNDRLLGDTGNDRLWGGSGDDLLDGGAGDDYLNGGETYYGLYGGASNGSDTYRFGRGGGQDVVVDVDDTAGNTDTILLDPDVLPDDVKLTRQGRNLVVHIAGSTDTLAVENWFEGSNYQVERIAFTDGMVWDVPIIKRQALLGTQEADVLVGYEHDDLIEGLSGDDVLFGNGGADRLSGGTGNDALNGGQGDDSYAFDRGYGQDVISDADATVGNVDTVVLGTGIAPADVSLKAVDQDLFLSVTDTGDSLRISGWFADDMYKVERIQFADGTVWGVATMQDIASRPTENDDYLVGTPGADALDGGGGNDWIDGLAGNDYLYGGAGDDYLQSGDGNDVLDGGTGDDYLDGGRGDDTYIIGRGKGFDSIYEYDNANNTVAFGQGITAGDLSIQFGATPRYGRELGGLAIGIGRNEGVLIRGMSDWGDYPLGGGEYRMLSAAVIGGGGNRTPGYGVQRFVFADGSELSLEQIIARADQGIIGFQAGTDGDDFLYGSVADDSIYANASNDRVDARDNDDWVDGGVGNDVLSAGFGMDVVRGGDGDDIIAGGADDDELSGGPGNDTYAFNLGDGHDSIDVEVGMPTEGVDTLSFGKGILPEAVSAYADADGSLILLIAGGKDRITTPWFDPADGFAELADHGIERAQFADAMGDVRIFDLTAIVRTQSEALRAADVDNPVPLFGDAQGSFELTGIFPTAGGSYAVAYAQTGDLFAMPTYYGGDAGDDVILGRAGDDTIAAGDGNNLIQAGDGDNVVTTGTGTDQVTTGGGNDVIATGAGDDVVIAGGGNDAITGGPGTDILFGGSGDDRYFFNPGDGVAVIEDLAAPGEGNHIVFGPGITPTDLRLSHADSKLVITIGTGGDAIHLANFSPADVLGAHAVETYEFADGTVLSYSQLLERGFDALGSGGNDLLLGTGASDRILGLGGDDVMVGGRGNDVLDGGSGDDVYVFNLGDGIDTLRDSASPGAGNTVQFGPGITPDDLRLVLRNHVLELSIGAGGDALRLEGFHPTDMSGAHAIESFRFSDGSVWSYGDLIGLGFEITGMPSDDALEGTKGDDIFHGMAGNDMLAGGAGNDTYHFQLGDGVDTIDDEAVPGGPNTLVFGPGIAVDDLRLGHDPDSGALIVAVGEAGDALRLSRFNTADPYGAHAIEYYQFADGRILTYSQLIDRGFDISGNDADNILLGTVATDRMVGNAGDDLLVGGAGNDVLMGGAGNDTYVYKRGDGVGVIDDKAAMGAGNILEFGPGITLADMANSLHFVPPSADGGGTFIIRLGDTGDEVHLKGFDPNDAEFGPHAVDTFKFADGAVINYRQLVQNTFVVQGDTGDDTLSGTSLTDRLYGYEGDDRLNGGPGDDVLTGGTGNDMLFGGDGGDTYVFNLGDGVDTIDDAVALAQGNLVAFGAGITPNDLRLAAEPGVLTLHVGNGGDAIRLRNFNPNDLHAGAGIDRFEFSDGTVL